MDTSSTLSTIIQSNRSLPCHLYRDKHWDPSMHVSVTLVFSLIYSTIFILGIVGNALIIYLTLRHRALQSVQNLFILNLAAADLLVCFVSLPITPISTVVKNWYFGRTLCHILPSTQAISVFISTFSLCAIALDRYRLLVFPHMRTLSKRHALFGIGVLWSLSFIVTTPYAFYMHLIEVDDYCGSFCVEQWPNIRLRHAYSIVVLFVQFVLPFFIMFVCYWRIFRHLRLRTNLRIQRIDECSAIIDSATNTTDHGLVTFGTHIDNNNTTSPSDRCLVVVDHGDAIVTKTTIKNDKLNGGIQKYKKKGKKMQRNNGHVGDERPPTTLRQQVTQQAHRTTMLLVTMVVLFSVTWLPHNVVMMITEFGGDDEQNFFRLTNGVSVYHLVTLCTHSIAMSNNAANPILYAWLNPTFVVIIRQTLIASIGNLVRWDRQNRAGPK